MTLQGPGCEDAASINSETALNQTPPPKELGGSPIRGRGRPYGAEFDDGELAAEADNLVHQFHKDASREAGIFHLITLPAYHTAALSTDVLARVRQNVVTRSFRVT